MIVGNLASQGKKPTTPTIGTATAGDGSATVPFTESTYRGKSNSGTYRATSSPGGIQGTCVAPCTSISVSGLSNGTGYTFVVRLETPYGVNSDNSASSNSVTPEAPPPYFPPPPPYFPPPEPYFPEPYFPPSFCPEGASCTSGGCGSNPNGSCTTLFGGCSCFFYG